MKAVLHLIFLTYGPILAFGGKMYTPINAWHKVACLAEQIKANNHYICDQHGHIICLPGWSDESQACNVPVCNFNGLTCDHGNCTAPQWCTCEIGWVGVACDTCLPLPGCLHGYCEDPLECICEDGWEGMFCDKPTCGICEHGHCSAPGVCTCHPGYHGENCDQCENNPDCHYGRCIDHPFECVCYDGFEGPFCDDPICSQGCHPEHGMCMQPDECWCRPGWQGPDCSQCVPYWNCVHGFCNEPFECICEDGYIGKDCNATEVVNGNWGQWGPWAGCCEDGEEIRTRKCDDPPPTGGGWYCSKDGSLATDSRTCADDLISCDAMPEWGEWSGFGSCSVTCGQGVMTRTRECSTGNPADCDGGVQLETQPCIEQICPIWTEWSAYSACSVTCGDGTRIRTRICQPNNNAAECGGGPELESDDCNDGPCPISNA